jgi:peptide/nickel transport system substrate-binding protein
MMTDRRPVSSRRTVASAVGVALVLLAASACTTVAQSSTKSSGTPTSLVVATSYVVTNLDPLENNYWSPELGYAELLMRPLADGGTEPWLLSSLKQEAPDTWRMTLRPKISFQNGDPLTAQALASMLRFNLAKNPECEAALPGAKVKVTGPLTLDLITSRVTSDVPHLLAYESAFPVYDQAAYNSVHGHFAELVGKRMFTGPWIVTSLTSSEMTMIANPHYWGPKPKFSSITIKFVADPNARLLAVEHGEVDMSFFPLRDQAQVLNGRTDAYYVAQPPGHGTSSVLMFMNLRQAPFNDLDVRKAVSMAINYKSLAQQVMNGQYDTATSLYPGSAPYVLKTQNTDVAAASALLKSDGWKAGSGGVLQKAGKPLQFNILTYPQAPDMQQLAIAIQAELKPLGIAVKVQQVPDFDTAVKSHTSWDAALAYFGLTNFSGDPIAPLVDYLIPNGQFNYGGIGNPTLTNLIKHAFEATDPTTQTSVLQQIQRLVSTKEAYLLDVGNQRTAVIVGPRFRNYKVPFAALYFSAFA